MSANSDLLDALKAARLAVVTKISGGQSIMEYSDGVIRIRKESPAALLAEITRQIREIEPIVAGEGNRSAAIACFGGPI